MARFRKNKETYGTDGRTSPPTRVCELTDQSTATRDKEKLEQFFLLMDIEVISNILICTRRQDVFWAWHYEKSRIFSNTIYLYRMLVDIKQRNATSFESMVERSDTRAVEKNGRHFGV